MKQATTRMLFSYWDTLRGERAAPERGEIEPGEIRHVLADTFILELEPDRRARIRLAGTRLCALFGGELKGRFFDGLWPERGSRDMRRSLDIVVEETAGLVAGLTGTTRSGQSLDLELLLLPLRHRGKPNARVLGAMAPAAVPTWLGVDPIEELTTTSLRVIWPSSHAPVPSVAAQVGLPARRRFVVHRGGRA